MRIFSIFCRTKPIPKPDYLIRFEQAIPDLMQKSEGAMREIYSENFNSKTLRTLCHPEFRPKTPETIMAVSTRESGKPVEVSYSKRLDEKCGLVHIDFFAKDQEKTPLGYKEYFLDTDASGNMVMKSGFMRSYDEACKKIGVMGLGFWGRMLQMKDAMERGIKKIPSVSKARATLFHLKSGFTPTQNLEYLTPVESLYDIEKVMKNIKSSSRDVWSKNYTPVIVSKEGKYYIDENATCCAAYRRQIRENYEKGFGDGVHPSISGWLIELELAGKNYETWEQIVKNMF